MAHTCQLLEYPEDNSGHSTCYGYRERRCILYYTTLPFFFTILLSIQPIITVHAAGVPFLRSKRQALKKNKQSEKIPRDKKDEFLKQSLLDAYKDELRARPTQFSSKCKAWLGVAFDGAKLTVKPPCTMCRCAYIIDYPGRALTNLDVTTVSSSKLHSVSPVNGHLTRRNEVFSKSLELIMEYNMLNLEELARINPISYLGGPIFDIQALYQCHLTLILKSNQKYIPPELW